MDALETPGPFEKMELQTRKVTILQSTEKADATVLYSGMIPLVTRWKADTPLGSVTAASLSQVAVPSAEDVRPHDYFLADTNSCSSRGPCRLKGGVVQGIHDVGGEEILRFCR
jgi:hypothetical protein